MDARELLPVLVDDGKYVLVNGAEEAGVSCLLTNILNRPISIVCFSRKIPSSAPANILKLLDRTLKSGTPVLFLFSSGSTADDNTSWCEVRKSIARLSGVCPLIALVSSDEDGYVKNLTPYMDFVVYTDGAHDQTVSCIQESGTISAIEKLRTLLAYLPLNCAESAPLLQVTKYHSVKKTTTLSFSAMANAISDPNGMLPLYTDLHVQIGFSRTGGRVIGVLACETGHFPAHAVRFISFCDCYSLPIVIVSEKPLVLAPAQFFALARATTVLFCVGACGDNRELFDYEIGVNGLDCKACDCLCSTEDLHDNVAQALELLHVKRDVLPPHKHSNFPII